MSRSRKKTPGFSCGGPELRKHYKRLAQKRTRQCRDSALGGAYKRLLDYTWNVIDYNCRDWSKNVDYKWVIK